MARGAASVLNLNCALVLLPVCRNLVNFARGAFEVRAIPLFFAKERRGLPRPAPTPTSTPRVTEQAVHSPPL